MITAIGNPVYDYIKTPRVDTKTRVLSGCSTNAALVLAKLGKQVRLVGAVGDDFKEQFLADLKKYGITPEISPSHETGGFSLVYYDEFGNRTLDIIGQADHIVALNPDKYAQSEAILVGPILKEITLGALRQIRENYKGFYFLDPQGLLRGIDDNGRILHDKPPAIEEACSYFDVIKPNEMEAKVLTGIDCRQDPYEAARILKSWGPKVVIVTLAELGSVIYDGDDFIDIPPYEVDLIDATGAGDTYMAGFTFEYLRTKDLRKAGCFASATSSIMIENVGPDFAMTEAMVRERQEKLLGMEDFKVKVGINMG